jgi:hypothetical protein
MDVLTLFGVLAVSAMLVGKALESRSHWFVLLFASRALSARPMGSYMTGSEPVVDGGISQL